MPIAIKTEVGNLDLLKILRQGPEVWNAWRERNPEVVIGLEEANLQKADLRGADLQLARALPKIKWVSFPRKTPTTKQVNQC